MGARKVLIAAGVVCVLAPAALAMMRSDRAGEYRPQQVAQTILQHLQELLIGAGGEAGAGRLPAQAGPVDARLPFTSLARVTNPDLFALRYPGVSHDGGPFAADAMEISHVAPGGPLGEGTTGRRAGASGDAASATAGFGGLGGFRNGHAASSFGAGAGGGGVAGGGGDGVGAGGASSVAPAGELRDLLLDVTDGELQPTGARPEPAIREAVTVMPLPASVWMLLASVVGLFLVGRLRAARSS